MFKTAFIIAFLIVIVIMAGMNDGNWGWDNYHYNQSLDVWLPMWVGLSIGFILTIGRDES